MKWLTAIGFVWGVSGAVDFAVAAKTSVDARAKVTLPLVPRASCKRVMQFNTMLQLEQLIIRRLNELIGITIHNELVQQWQWNACSNNVMVLSIRWDTAQINQREKWDRSGMEEEEEEVRTTSVFIWGVAAVRLAVASQRDGDAQLIRFALELARLARLT